MSAFWSSYGRLYPLNVRHQLGKLRAYPQPPAISTDHRSVYLTVGRVPTPESIRLNEAVPPLDRVVMTAPVAGSRLGWSRSEPLTVRQLPFEGGLRATAGLQHSCYSAIRDSRHPPSRREHSNHDRTFGSPRVDSTCASYPNTDSSVQTRPPWHEGSS